MSGMFIYISVICTVLLIVVSKIGERKGLYGKGGKNGWFGKVMHFLGGFFVAMFWSGLINDLLLIISLTLLVGIAWEFFEYFYGLYKLKKSGTKKYMTKIPDTIEDLVLDTFGAVAWIIVSCMILP